MFRLSRRRCALTKTPATASPGAGKILADDNLFVTAIAFAQPLGLSSVRETSVSDNYKHSVSLTRQIVLDTVR